MSDLVVAANRGPFSLAEREDGSIEARPGGGGLAPSVAAALSAAGREALWVATAMTPAEHRAAKEGTLETGQAGLSLRLVELDAGTYASAYDVIANSTLWFLFHGLFDAARRPVFDQAWRQAWEAFREYNAAFGDRICEEASTAATVLVNDYHLPLVGRVLAERRPDLSTVHFTHTPFASADELAMLPRHVRRELIDGLSGFGACGFHTPRWQHRFEEAAAAVAGHAPETFAAPLGADRARLDEVAASPACAERLAELEERVGDRTVIVRSDRMELSKNLLRGFLAFDALLEERPELRGRVCFVARAYASREGLAEYLAYRSETEHLAALLNEKWAPRCGGEPPILLDVDDDFPSTVAAFRRYDVLLVNPVRDGMNLVAKEGPLVNEHDGLLVCSEQAGAYDELSDVALGVQPFDVTDTAAALARALDMPAEERRRRSAELARRATRGAPASWLAEVLSHARPQGDLAGS
ncbi:MAG TPA: trehalose-6-phosphate synthase [Acidimicrobiales bacterium]|nr:trehalose-6-phosphate synthase [Acidimicrobiales bacterium]